MENWDIGASRDASMGRPFKSTGSISGRAMGVDAAMRERVMGLSTAAMGLLPRVPVWVKRLAGSLQGFRQEFNPYIQPA